jgi:hypothetical protein
MRTCPIRTLAAAIGLLILPGASPGTVLTFVMEGTVQSVTDPAGLLPAVQAGQRAAYAYSFDSELRDNSWTVTSSLVLDDSGCPGLPGLPGLPSLLSCLEVRQC